jgi:hypothetical protein
MGQDYIEIKRVTNDKSGQQISAPEAIPVSDIHTFRPWHKGLKDTLDGEITLIILTPNSKVLGNDKTTKEIHIHESYKSFLKRMSGRVIVLANE